MAPAALMPGAADSAPECWKRAHRWTRRRWRKAFPGARRGFWGDSASGRSILGLIGDECFVRGGIHQRFELRRIGETHLHEPGGTVRIGIDLLRRFLQIAVGLDHFTGDRSINVTD